MNEADVERIVRDAVGRAKAGKSVTVKKEITLSAAEAIIKRVFAAAEQMGFSAVAAVADAGANIVAVMRMDGAFTASYDIACSKAYTSAALKLSTDKLSKLAAPGGELYGIQQTNGGKIVIFGGGEPLCYEGEVVGSLGVSGGSLAQDTELAAIGKKYWEETVCR